MFYFFTSHNSEGHSGRTKKFLEKTSLDKWKTNMQRYDISLLWRGIQNTFSKWNWLWKIDNAKIYYHSIWENIFFLYMLPEISLLYLLLRNTDRISQKCILMIFISVLSYIGKISFDGSYKNRKPRKNFLSPLISILIFGVLCYVLYLYVLAQHCMRIA